MDRVATTDVVYLETVVPVMRRLGVTSFAGLELGAEAAVASAVDESNPAKPATIGEQEKRARERRILTSGGPRPSLAKL